MVLPVSLTVHTSLQEIEANKKNTSDPTFKMFLHGSIIFHRHYCPPLPCSATGFSVQALQIQMYKYCMLKPSTGAGLSQNLGLGSILWFLKDPHWIHSESSIWLQTVSWGGTWKSKKYRAKKSSTGRKVITSKISYKLK